MGVDLMDLLFRIERGLGVRVTRDQFLKLAQKHEPPDIFVGELFEFVRGLAPSGGVLDLELDGEGLWPIFQRAISDALGVDLDEVTKDKGLVRDLGAS